jgi:hypothetical protein
VPVLVPRRPQGQERLLAGVVEQLQRQLPQEPREVIALAQAESKAVVVNTEDGTGGAEAERVMNKVEETHTTKCLKVDSQQRAELKTLPKKYLVISSLNRMKENHSKANKRFGIKFPVANATGKRYVPNLFYSSCF